MIDHEEIEALLGAYALDAVSPEEAATVEAHLLECPRCGAEVARHREAAALLASGGAEAPTGVWDRIASELRGEDERADLAPTRLLARVRSTDRRSRRRRLLVPVGAAAAAVGIALGLLSAQISHLSGEVHQEQAIVAHGGLASAVAATLAAPHRTIVLAAAHTSTTGTVAVGANGTAYWVRGNLKELANGRTYQLWGLASGRVVSLGLLGPNPNAYSAFRLQPNVSTLMVTAEPEGGTTTPTTPVLLQGAVAAA